MLMGAYKESPGVGGRNDDSTVPETDDTAQPAVQYSNTIRWGWAFGSIVDNPDYMHTRPVTCWRTPLTG